MLTVFFLINISLLVNLIYNYKLFSAESISFLIFLFYGFSFYIDNIFFGIDDLYVNNLGSININSDNYLIIALLYTIFLISYCFGLRANKSNMIKEASKSFNDKSLRYRLTLILFSSAYLYIIYNLITLSRSDKLIFFSNNKSLSIVVALGLFVFIIVGLKSVSLKKKPNLIEKVFLITSVLCGLFEGGREIFIYIFLILIPYVNRIKNKLILIIVLPIFLFFVTTWKAISIFIFQLGNVNQFSEWFSSDFSFSLSSLDPKVSILLINKYLNGNHFFDDLYFSYFINTISQFLSAIGIIEYQSIGKQIVKHFDPVGYSYGRGFAFSGILESLLNFWFFGPILLGFFSGFIMSKIRKIDSERILSVFFIIIMLKLVRTELAVVLKIYLLPMTLSYLMIFKRFKIL